MRFATCFAFMLPLAAIVRADLAANLTSAHHRYEHGFHVASNALASVVNQTAASSSSQELRVFHAMQHAANNISSVRIKLVNFSAPIEAIDPSIKYVDSLCARTMS